MTGRLDTDDYRGLFLTPTPMIDLRAPVEYTRGAFPCALSLPLMSDEERALVGICYKEKGQDAAITLGHELVAGELKAQRIAQWADFSRQHPQGYLYCWRGGLRSQTVQSWLREAGIDYPRIVGGYKAMRTFLLEELEKSVLDGSFVLIGGRTGTGKTRVIERLTHAVDLEGLANHRGSTFGQMPTPQPSQIDFENSLSIALMRLLAQGADSIFLEDEGRMIGRTALPNALREKMSNAPMVVVEQSVAERVDVVLEDYVMDLGRRYLLLHAQEGPVLHREKLLSDLGRISRRLGGDRHKLVDGMINRAFDQQWDTGDASAHREWIAYLLELYYDPMYDYQLQQRKGSCLFRGDRQAVVEWVQENS
jgi:tRNA 2-selenouridine synthase